MNAQTSFLFSFGQRRHSHIRHLLESARADQKSTGRFPWGKKGVFSPDITMSIRIEEGVALGNFTTMRVGGKAHFFARVRTVQDIEEAARFAEDHGLRLLVLGGGSNLLISDAGVHGLVIKIELKGTSFETKGGEGSTRMILSGGEVWDDVVRRSVERGLWGIENLSLIPGTVGGAVVQNIGAYGKEVCEHVAWVEVYDIERMAVRMFGKSDCVFGYRSSIFKSNKKLVVTRVAIDLSLHPRPRLEHEDVRRYIAEHRDIALSPENIRAAVIAIRTAKLPSSSVGTAGSFFKNPIVSLETFLRLQEKFPELHVRSEDDGRRKLSAAWLLDNVGGWRGVRLGNVGTHERQALVVVNHGNASSREIFDFAQKMKASIYQKTGVMLEEEVVVVS